MLDLVKALSALLKAKNMKLVTAESCTGGLLAAAITHDGGASQVFERGFITYSNASKCEELGVGEDLLERYGAVSAEVVTAMACGALCNARADVALSITGIAGPDGGSTDKPVGTVYIGYAIKGGAADSVRMDFPALSREAVQEASAAAAVKHLISILEKV